MLRAPGSHRKDDRETEGVVYYSVVRPKSYGEFSNLKLQITPVIKSPFIR